MIIKFDCADDIVEVVNAANINNFWTFSRDGKDGVEVRFNSGESTTLHFDDEDDVREAAATLTSAMAQQKQLPVVKGHNMLKEIASDMREFIKQNRSVIYTVALVALVDHFVFEGAFRTRLKALVDKFLTKAEKAIK